MKKKNRIENKWEKIEKTIELWLKTQLCDPTFIIKSKLMSMANPL